MWRSQYFLHKRRNIFNIQGTAVSLSSYIPAGVEEAASAAAGDAGAAAGLGAAAAAAAAPSADEFPPLSGGASGSGTLAGGGCSGSAAGNPLLAAFASERRAMEQLRDDVQSKLAAFKVTAACRAVPCCAACLPASATCAAARTHRAPLSTRPALPLSTLQSLSELQKENAGLRAACITLGRELLTLKTDFEAFKQAAAPALALGSGTDAAAAAGLTRLSPAASNGANAAVAAVAALQAAARASPQGNGSSTPTHAAAAAAPAGLGPSRLGYLPTTMTPAPAKPELELPSGEIALVGGHDGGIWLDSAGGRQWAWVAVGACGMRRRQEARCAAAAASASPYAHSLGSLHFATHRRLLLAKGVRLVQPAAHGYTPQLLRRGGHE